MKEQIETAVPRRKFVAGERDEARKTATGHSCEPLNQISQNPEVWQLFFKIIFLIKSGVLVERQKNKILEKE